MNSIVLMTLACLGKPSIFSTVSAAMYLPELMAEGRGIELSESRRTARRSEPVTLAIPSLTEGIEDDEPDDLCSQRPGVGGNEDDSADSEEYDPIEDDDELDGRGSLRGPAERSNRRNIWSL